MKSENLLVTISLAILILTNVYSESFALSPIVLAILNITAIVFAITALLSQLKKKFSRKYAFANK